VISGNLYLTKVVKTDAIASTAIFMRNMTEIITMEVLVSKTIPNVANRFNLDQSIDLFD
jgi:hypothetical protein